MRKFNKTQRNYMIIGLCTILIIMAVGYAAFASSLRISGTSSISSNFLVKITNIAVSEKIGSASDKTDITTYNDTSAAFGVSLVSPGDSITYDITIANQGTMDAVLKLITKTDTNNSAILFETSGVNEGDELKAGEMATMKVKVTYNSAVTSQPEDLESNLNLSLDYEQYKDPNMPIPSGETLTLGGQEVDIVTGGNGLYADEYESGRYLYKGSNPNNYVTFNNEEWRIISIESDGSIKILRNSSLENKVFDSKGLRDSNSNGAGGTYCARSGSGCNAWALNDNFVNGRVSGTVLKDAELNTYLNEEYYNGITGDKDKIVSHNFSVGPIIDSNNDLAEQITSENSYKWNGKVGLVTASEYIRANSNQSECGTFSLNNSNYSTCQSTNWMITGSYWWTLSPGVHSTTLLWHIDYGGRLDSRYYSYSTYGVRPVLYLSSDITLRGEGSSSNPFTLE